MSDKDFNLFGMPIHIRDYVPKDKILVISKKGKSSFVKKAGKHYWIHIDDADITELSATQGKDKDE